MKFATLFAVVASVALGSARIVGIAPHKGTLGATSTSTFPLVFTTSNSLSAYRDHTAVIGVSWAASHKDPTATGTWITNLDFEALGKDSTGTGNFTVKVPITSDAIGRNGTYVLTAVIVETFGVAWYAGTKIFNVTFNAHFVS